MFIAAEQLILDYNSKKAAFYNQKDDIVGLIDFENEENVQIIFYELNSKIESLSFYCVDYLAFGFKDQSVKVLRICDMGKIQTKKKLNKVEANKDKKN